MDAIDQFLEREFGFTKDSDSYPIARMVAEKLWHKPVKVDHYAFDNPEEVRAFIQSLANDGRDLRERIIAVTKERNLYTVFYIM